MQGLCPGRSSPVRVLIVLGALDKVRQGADCSLWTGQCSTGCSLFSVNWATFDGVFIVLGGLDSVQTDQPCLAGLCLWVVTGLLCASWNCVILADHCDSLCRLLLGGFVCGSTRRFGWRFSVCTCLPWTLEMWYFAVFRSDLNYSLLSVNILPQYYHHSEKINSGSVKFIILWRLSGHFIIMSITMSSVVLTLFSSCHLLC